MVALLEGKGASAKALPARAAAGGEAALDKKELPFDTMREEPAPEKTISGAQPERSCHPEGAAAAAAVT
jgi:hypothetical protein